ICCLANPRSLRLRSLSERLGWWESSMDICLATDIPARRLRSSCYQIRNLALRRDMSWRESASQRCLTRGQEKLEADKGCKSPSSSHLRTRFRSSARAQGLLGSRQVDASCPRKRPESSAKWIWRPVHSGLCALWLSV